MTRVPAAVFGGTAQGSGNDAESVAPASATSTATEYVALGAAFTTGATIFGIAIRASGHATFDDFTPTWNASAERIRWRVGLDTAEENPAAEIPKGALAGWVQTSMLTTQPNGDPWTVAAISALEVALRVGWNSNPTGSVTLALVDSQVLVYVVQEADLRTVHVGAGEPPTRWVGEEG